MTLDNVDSVGPQEPQEVPVVLPSAEVVVPTEGQSIPAAQKELVLFVYEEKKRANPTLKETEVRELTVAAAAAIAFILWGNRDR